MEYLGVSMEYLGVGDLGDLFKGLQTIETSSNSEKLETVKVFNYKMLQMLTVVKDIKFMEHIRCMEYNLSKKYKDCYIQNNDIIIPVFPNKEKLQVLYIEDVTADNCIYNDSSIILRISDNKINKKYVKMFLQTAIEHKLKFIMPITAQTRITIKMLQDIQIPLLSEQKQNEMVKQYEDATEMLEHLNAEMLLLVKGV